MKLSLLTTLFVVIILAQTPSATLVGRVTDPAGGVVPGVGIIITNIERNVPQQGVTNDAGDFTIPYLNPGRYTLEALARISHC